jgi:hypothetical protein
LNLNSSGYYRSNGDRLASTVIDGDAVLVDLATGVYYSLDGTAGTVWQMIENGRTVEEIAQRLASLYDTTPAQALSDVESLVLRLLKEDLIVEAAPSEPAAPEPLPDHRSPYRTPTLEMYTDMSDLLALDPPMPGLFANDPKK